MTLRVLLSVLLCAVAPQGAYAQLATGGVVVVLPFENPQANPRVLWLREGLASLLSDAIDAAGFEVVGRDDRLAAFERLQLPVAATLSRPSTVRVGHWPWERRRSSSAGSSVAGEDLQVTPRSVRLDNGRLLPDIADPPRWSRSP